MNLSSSTKTTVVHSAAAVGTTSLAASVVIDMQDYEGVVFIAQFGAVTDGSPGVKAGGGAASNGSDASDFLGSNTADTAAAATGQAAVLDIYRPTQRYITATVVRGGSTGAVLDSVIAIQYGPKAKPTTNDATTVAATTLLVSPALGTA